MTFRGPVYDKLKYLTQIVLPALGTLYVAVAALWDLPAPQEVAGTILAVDAFLGIVLQISSSNFQGDGQMVVIPDPTGRQAMTYSLELDGDPEDFQHQDKVTFKVKKPLGSTPNDMALPETTHVSSQKPTRRRGDAGLALVEALVLLALVVAVVAVLFAAGVFK